MPRPFATLTKRGQTARLRALALGHLRAWPLEVRTLRRLAAGFNTSFRLTTAEGDRAVVRVHRPGWRTPPMIDAELRWLEALARDTDVAVARPLRARDGRTCVEARSPGVPEPRQVSVLSWLPGRLLVDRLSPDTTAALGALLARLHVHTARWRDVDAQLLRVDGPWAALPRVWPDLPAELLPPSRRAVFEAAEARVVDAFAALRETGPPQLCHLDLHPHNVLVTRAGALAPIDFDDCALSWPALDVGISLHYLRARAPDRGIHAHLADLRRGYTAVAPLDAPDDLLLALAAARQFILVNHLCHEVDPALAALFPGFLATAEERLTP